jgi:hypothetical protein
MALGQVSNVYLRSENVDTAITRLQIKTDSSIYLNAGFGFKKRYPPMVTTAGAGWFP